jgi:hypothetical protein
MLPNQIKPVSNYTKPAPMGYWMQLELGIIRWIKDIHGDPSFNQRNAPLDDFLERQLIFVTFHSSSRSDHLVEFEKLLFRTMKATIGNKLGRKEHLQPRAFAFLDTPGSSKNIKRDIRECPNRHVHAVIICRHDSADRIFRFLDAESKHGRNEDDQSEHKRLLDVQRFDRNKGTMQKLIHYCVKGLTATPPNADIETWVSLPRSSTESTERWDFKRFAKMLDHDGNAKAKQREDRLQSQLKVIIGRLIVPQGGSV